jgi:parallel beta-helix repeat protein
MSPFRFAFFFACAIIASLAALSPAAEPSPRTEIHVGGDGGTNLTGDALQAAVDQAAATGGGTVHVGTGRYLLRSALTLRSGVNVVGEPGKSVLVACDSVSSPLASDGDCNERQITLQDPAGFRIGDGVLVRDERSAHGFAVTTARITRQVDANTFKIDAPLYFDYMMAQKASATLVFPVVGGWNVHDVHISGLTIEGNRDKTVLTDGCRSGGIYLFQCQNIAIRNCVVQHYNGDGISFQVSENVTVEDCRVDANSGLGLHPGSGSQRPVVRRNQSTGNGGDGMFVCWRVQGGVFEKNLLTNNSGAGISIGHKDSDNLFRENTITGNARAGVFFRNETEPMGAHRNVFEKNAILDNNRAGGDHAAAIVIRGCHNNLVFRDNVIGNTTPAGPATIGIAPGKLVNGMVSENNQFQNLRQEIAAEK